MFQRKQLFYVAEKIKDENYKLTGGLGTERIKRPQNPY